MKTQMLKIAGVNNEKDFYKLYPTQESFMAKHGAAFKKAQYGLQTVSQLKPIKNNFELTGEAVPDNLAAMQSDATPIDSGMGGDTTQYIQSGIQAVGAGINAKNNFKNERARVKNARAWADTSEVVKKAFNTLDIDAPNVRADNARRKREALMPAIDAESLFPAYGVGTNILAKHGGEIMNTYAPNDIYKDLGYVPIAQNGTGMRSQYFQDNAPSWTSFANAASSVTENIQGPDAGSELGGDLGQAAGSAVGMYFGGPVGAAALGALGKWAGGSLGGALDKNDDKIKAANARMNANVAEISGISEFRNNYRDYAEDGANMNPMVIKYFGDHSVSSLLKPDPMMNTLRTGGNIRQNSVGDIEAVSGGYLEPTSYNPYSDGSGITSMIKGQTHDESNGRHSGVLLNYDKANHGSSGAQVEAENNEPITEIGDSAVIFGDQVINDLTVGGDPMFKGLYGKTFKKAMAGVAEQNQKLNTKQTKNTIALNNIDVKTPIDKLTFNSLAMNAKGIDTRYAINDAIMKKAAAHQEVVNNEAARLGINSGDFSRGKLSPADNVAKSGGSFTKAQYGLSAWEGNTTPGNKYGNKTKSSFSEAEWNDIAKNLGFTGKGNKEFQEFLLSNPEAKPLIEARHKELYGQAPFVDEKLGYGWSSDALKNLKSAPVTPATTTAKITTPAEKDKVYGVSPYKKAGWETIAGQILPWMRKQPGEGLQGDQLAGEMFALSNNQEEPVQARYFHPQLRTPYDISYQDQLNENQADFNQLVDVTGSNPQTLAALAAQKYGANSKVLAEQFRANQAMKDQVYSGNINTLNDAQLKNLQIADQQYVRQAQAKSATKAIKQEAISSISSKIGQNRLENRTLQTYANMFPDYSFDKSYRIRHTGAPVDWQIDQGIYNPKGEVNEVPVYNDKGEITKYRSITATKEARYGGIIKAFKDI